MKKPVFSVEELRTLLSDLDNSSADDTEQLSVVKESLSGYILSTDEERNYDVHQLIAGEAATLEYRAKMLRSIVRAFKKPMNEVPKDMNDQNAVISSIARWRLRLGK